MSHDAREINARIMSTVKTWYETRQIARLPNEDAEMIDSIIKGALDGNYTLENLDYGYSILTSYRKLQAHINRHLQSNPDFDTEHNRKILNQWATEHPQSSAYDFNVFIEGHKFDGTFEWKISQSKLIRMFPNITSKTQIEDLKLQFGAATVDEAWKAWEAAVHGPVAKQHHGEGRGVEEETARKETRQKQNNFFEQLKDRAAQTQAEAIVANFRRNNNWADIQDCRQELEAIKVYKVDGKMIDWAKTIEMRKARADRLQREGDRL